MKVAIVGIPAVDNIESVILKYLPKTTTEIWCAAEENGAAANLAATLNVAFRTVTSGKDSDLLRAAEEFLVFWSGEPDHAGRIAARCVKEGKPVRLIPLSLL